MATRGLFTLTSNRRSTPTRHALDYSREHGWKVEPRCPYVAAWIKRHPEHQDLVAGGAE
jgi:hypothetical protein